MVKRKSYGVLICFFSRIISNQVFVKSPTLLTNIHKSPCLHLTRHYCNCWTDINNYDQTLTYNNCLKWIHKTLAGPIMCTYFVKNTWTWDVKALHYCTLYSVHFLKKVSQYSETEAQWAKVQVSFKIEIYIMIRNQKT